MTSKIENDLKRPRGRPPAFDRAEAVRAAMLLFWERGYEGSTFDDLTAAMGINASSFRNTFKSKEALYREATEAYAVEMGDWFASVLAAEANVRAAFARLFAEAATLYTRGDRPAGCMISLAATHVPASMAPLKDMMAAHRAGGEQAMAQRIAQGQRDGQIGADLDSALLAAFFNTVFRGMALQARDGASTGRLRDIGRVALMALPG